MNILLMAALAANMQITLREQLNQTYGPQSLSYPYAGSAAQVTGPRGPVPAQVADGRLVFVIDGLAPLATEKYEITAGKSTLPPVSIGELPEFELPGAKKSSEAGPAFARVQWQTTNVTLSATQFAGDTAVRWELDVREDQTNQFITFKFPTQPGVKEMLSLKGYGQWAKADRKLPVVPGDKPVCFLSPNTSVLNIFPEHPSTIILGDLQFASRDPGAWVDPVAPFTYGGFKTWNLDMVPKSWENWKRKCLPVFYAADGTVTLQASLAKGRRKWRTGATKVGEELDVVKDMVLDWPTQPHPALFVDKAERTPDEVAKITAALRADLDKFGNLDVMRQAIHIAGKFDAARDTLTPVDCARFAYFAHIVSDPMCWSAERGYHSGNPNMSCCYILSLGVIACAIPDHPMAKQWADYATKWMDKWLDDEVGPNGEWLSEGGHYGYVSLAPMLSYAIAAQRAGFADFTNDPRLKKLVTFFAKYNTPRDPMCGGYRGLPVYGRGALRNRLGVFGMAAKMSAGKDDAFSRQMQWMWQENGYPGEVSDNRLAGNEKFYLDRTLPAEKPAWTSELFPSLGALLRHDLGTTNECYLNLLSHDDSRHNLDIWSPEIGGISQWFVAGKPICSSFSFKAGYMERHELLRNGVRLTHNWGAPGDKTTPFGYYTKIKDPAFAALPTLDYVRTTIVNTEADDRDWMPENVPAFPRQPAATSSQLEWTRQLLHLTPYIVLRDTTHGGQPTAWQFWSYSQSQTNAPATELPPGNRYTMPGPFGMDVEYFIASPTDTPRHTLRYGGVHGSNHIPDYQDLLHLQQPGDGSYFVVVYPRVHDSAAPAFSAHGNILKIGDDYAFLSETDIDANLGDISFRGTAGAIQQSAGQTTLSLGAPGEVHWKKFSLKAPTAAALRITDDKLLVSAPAGGELTVNGKVVNVPANNEVVLKR